MRLVKHGVRQQAGVAIEVCGSWAVKLETLQEKDIRQIGGIALLTVPLINQVSLSSYILLEISIYLKILSLLRLKYDSNNFILNAFRLRKDEGF